MSEASSKLRLEIVTALDAAGISATKAQVDALEKGIAKTNTAAKDGAAKFGSLEKALGNLPGPIGQIARAANGLLGTLGLMAGALKLGIDLGNKIQDTLQGWGMVADPAKERAEAQRRYNREMAASVEQISLVMEAELKSIDATDAAAAKAIKRIDAQTAAHFRQASAIDGLRKAQGSGELLQLEREKFEEMADYSAQGWDEAAEQIGRYYDVLIETARAEQDLAAFDRESAGLAKKRTDAEAAYAVAAEKVERTKARESSAYAALDAHQRGKGVYAAGSWRYWDDADAAEAERLEAVAEKSRKSREHAEEVLAKRAEAVEGRTAEELQRQMERANLAAGGRLAIDRAALAYDQFADANGNPLNATVDPKWAQDMIAKSQEAYLTQREMLAAVKGLADKMEHLLEVK